MLTHFIGKRILVSGASGYLATNLIHLLKDVTCHIIRLSRQSGLPMVKGAADIVDVGGNVCERDIWEKVLKGVDIVYHLAAQTSVYEADQNPLGDLKINVMPILNLLETCRQHGYQPDVLFSSTVTISGNPERLPVNEAHPDNPITVYDLHKLMAEQYLKHYVNEGIVRGAALRLANVYGPGPESSRSDRGILNRMIRKALEGEPLTIYGKGDQLRDYVYVEDVAWAFIEAARSIEAISGQHFIIGSGQGYTIAEALKMVADRVALKKGGSIEVRHIDPPSTLLPIEFRNFFADSSRFIQKTNWKPRHSLVQGIDNLIEVLI